MAFIDGKKGLNKTMYVFRLYVPNHFLPAWPYFVKKEMPAPHCELGLVDMKANGLLAKNVLQKRLLLASLKRKPRRQFFYTKVRAFVTIYRSLTGT